MIFGHFLKLSKWGMQKTQILLEPLIRFNVSNENNSSSFSNYNLKYSTETQLSLADSKLMIYIQDCDDEGDSLSSCFVKIG